jgi:glycosyltransferase involved in cell wall biosynthesis
MLENEPLPKVTPAPISAIIPVHNQQAALETILDSWVKALAGTGSGYELILIDDGSTDRTRAVAEAQAARHPEIQLIYHPSHLGFGAALRAGLATARHALVLYAEGNPAYRPSDVKAFSKGIDQVHLVVGYRVWQSRGHRLTWQEWASRWLVRLLFGVRMRDVGCLFVLARRAIFGRIPIQSNGPFAHIEVLAKANFLGCLLMEAPVNYQPGASPPVAGEPSSRRRTVTEAKRLFFHPDFGPAILPS